MSWRIAMTPTAQLPQKPFRGRSRFPILVVRASSQNGERLLTEPSPAVVYSRCLMVGCFVRVAWF